MATAAAGLSTHSLHSLHWLHRACWHGRDWQALKPLQLRSLDQLLTLHSLHWLRRPCLPTPGARCTAYTRCAAAHAACLRAPSCKRPLRTLKACHQRQSIMATPLLVPICASMINQPQISIWKPEIRASFIFCGCSLVIEMNDKSRASRCGHL